MSDRGFGYKVRQESDGRHERPKWRGDVRSSVLVLLLEEPMHGYQLMRELGRRSGGRWTPTASAVYPMIQQLEDEGLVRATQSLDGKRVVELTNAGREEAARVGAASARRPWEPPSNRSDTAERDLLATISETARVLVSAAAAATESQRAQIADLLDDLRQRLVSVVPKAGGESARESGGVGGAGAPGPQRGPQGFPFPGQDWSFDLPGWIFRGGLGQIGRDWWGLAGRGEPGGSATSEPGWDDFADADGDGDAVADDEDGVEDV